jgi:DNA polymerase/3'-5' exonuclease PolX
MLRSEALPIAEALVESMRPYVDRVQIAGSIRRGKAEVKDIEIVAIPKFELRPEPDSLFEESLVATNLLFADWRPEPDVARLDDVRWLAWIQGRKPQGKWWKGQLWRGEITPGDESGCVMLDLFLVNHRNWGLQLALRTGNAKFSEALVTHAKLTGFPSEGGYLHGRDGRELDTPEEQDVFDILALEWVAPEERIGPQAVRPTRELMRRAS